MQAAFKIKEFRELTKMDDCRVTVDLNKTSNLHFNDDLLVCSVKLFLRCLSDLLIYLDRIRFRDTERDSPSYIKR